MARLLTKARRCRADGSPPPCQHGLGGPGRPQAANLSWPASGPPFGRQDPVNHARRVLRPRRPLNRARKRAVQNRSRYTTLQGWPEKEGRSLPRPAPNVEKGFTAAQGARGCVFRPLASPILADLEKTPCRPFWTGLPLRPATAGQLAAGSAPLLVAVRDRRSSAIFRRRPPTPARQRAANCADLPVFAGLHLSTMLFPGRSRPALRLSRAFRGRPCFSSARPAGPTTGIEPPGDRRACRGCCCLLLYNVNYNIQQQTTPYKPT